MAIPEDEEGPSARAECGADGELLRIKEALEEETRVLELLNQTGTMLASKLDLQAVVQAVTDAATAMSGAEFGAFFYKVARPDGSALSLYTLAGAPREAFEKFGHPRATPLFGPTFRGEGVIRSGDVLRDPRYGQAAPHHGMPPGHLPVRSYLAVPVISRLGEVMGGLFFGHRACDVFTERTERLIVGIAAQAAIAIDNARLYEEAKRQADERARLLEAERAARAEVERISVIKDEFLATLSHELRTPLSAVLGWSQVLLSRTKQGDGVRRGIETIARSARAQAQLIEDLLDMNRIISGKLRLELECVELGPVIEAVLESVKPALQAKAIRVSVAIEPEATTVGADPQRLQQILWNLLANSVKFTPDGGRIELSARREREATVLTVTDSGIGIEAEFLPHLFERFRQADSSTTRKYGGLGLGLSIVKHLVELHGGCVEARSAGAGSGATFLVRLPVRSLRAAARPGAQEADSQADLSLANLKVLVVDDDPDARELMSAILSEAHASVVTAESAAAGLEAVRTGAPDVVVCDIAMPERDGYQFVRDLRRLPRRLGGATPAIACTAFARSEDRARAMLAGYQVHLAKPIEPRELLATVKSLSRQAGTSSGSARESSSPRTPLD